MSAFDRKAYMKDYRPKRYQTHKAEQLEYNKKYYHAHRDVCLSRAKKRSRTILINTTINGKKVRIRAPGKRPWPTDDACEVCGSNPKKLAYHHWDDNNFSKGVWVCHRCHMACEGVDDGKAELYIRWRKEFDATRKIMAKDGGETPGIV